MRALKPEILRKIIENVLERPLKVKVSNGRHLKDKSRIIVLLQILRKNLQILSLSTEKSIFLLDQHKSL